MKQFITALFLAGSLAAQGLEIIIGDPITFAVNSSGNGVLAEKFRGGTIYVGLIHQSGAGPHGFRSTDGGKTWEPAPYAGVAMAQISDGRVIAFEARTRRTKPGEFIARMRVSRDGWKTVQGPFDVPVRIPQGTGGTDDGGDPFEGPLPWRSIVEMPNGDLLCTMYGYFEGDNVPIDMPPDSPLFKKPGFNKYRTIVIRSKDRGVSWDYLSTIAYDPKVGQEGFCEPAMTLLRDGRLLAIMRTGYTHDPMYESWSSDGGKTWTKPVSTGVIGVDPDLIVLNDGVVACGYGVKARAPGMRRERNIMFSLDNGRTWTHHTLVFGGEGGSYPAVREIRPGELLYVWEAQAFAERLNKPRPVKLYILGAIVKMRKRR